MLCLRRRRALVRAVLGLAALPLVAAAQTVPSAREAAACAGAHAAARQGDVAAIERIGGEQRGALEARDANGRTPLQIARARGCAAMVRLLEAAPR